MKQSSIEWLHSNNETICEMLLLDKIPKSTYEQLINCFSMNLEHAKAMHKDEIENAYISNSMIRTRSKAEEYYNETFNTEECYHKGKYTYNKETFECHKCGLIVPNEYRFNSKEK